jgi:ribosomal protein S21
LSGKIATRDYIKIVSVSSATPTATIHFQLAHKGVNNMPEVKVRKNDPIERALRHLRKKMDKENTLDELRSRECYIPPCEARRRAAGIIR